MGLRQGTEERGRVSGRARSRRCLGGTCVRARAGAGRCARHGRVCGQTGRQARWRVVPQLAEHWKPCVPQLKLLQCPTCVPPCFT